MRSVRITNLRSVYAPPSSPSKRQSSSLRQSTSSFGHERRVGDAIRFASTSVGTSMEVEELENVQSDVLSGKAGGEAHEWQVGDPIVFASTAPTRTAGGANGKGKAEASSSQPAGGGTSTALHSYFPSLPRSSPSHKSTTAATLGSPHLSDLTSTSADSWPLTHRWDPPSPSASRRSSGSTARFSLSRSYAVVGSPRASPSPKTPGTSGANQDWDEVEVGSLGARDEWGFGRVEMGVQAGSPQVRQMKVATSSKLETKPAVQLTQMELDSLVDGIDFGEDFEMSEDDFHSATGSPPPPSPHVTLRTHRGPPSPLSASCETDLFSPAPSSSFRPPALPSAPFKSSATSFALFPLRLSSVPQLHSHAFSTAAAWSSKDSFLETVSALVDREPPAAAKPKPKPKTALKRAAKVVEIESDDDVVIISGGGRKEALGSDSEVEVLTKPSLDKGKGKAFPAKAKATVTKSVPAKPSTKTAVPAPPAAKSGWLTRPSSLTTSLHPSAPPKSSTTSSAPKASTSAPARKTAQPPPPAASARPKAPRTYQPGTAAYKNAEKKVRSEAREKDLKGKHEPFRHERWPTRPRLVYTVDAEEVERELAAMTGPLGFDLEWEPSRRRGMENKTAVAQICDEKTILLVHVARMRAFPPSLKTLIEDANRVKLGVQISGDANKLQRDFKHVPAGLLELNNVARTVDAEAWVNRKTKGLVGLQALVGRYLDKYLEKGAVRTGKWEGELDEEQRYYAANDVYSSLQVFLYLQERAQPGVDVLACVSHNPRTASSWITPKSTLPFVRQFPPSSSAHPNDEPTSTIAPRAVGHPAPTARQRETYKLWYERGLSVDEVSKELDGALKPLSVVWSILACVAGDSSLPIDDARLLAGLDEVDGGSKWKMVEEYADVLEAAEERLRLAKVDANAA